MAFLTPNPLLGALKGKVGDLYIAKYGDKYVLKRLPVRKKRAPTSAQKPARQSLVDALGYWQQVKQTPELHAAYVAAAQRLGKRAYDLAKADFMSPPVVTDVDLSALSGPSGGLIRIQAEDNFEVRAVRIRILSLDGTLIEEGQAASGGKGQWEYRGQTTRTEGQAVVVEVTAEDRPGHKAVKRVDHILRAASSSGN